MRNANLLSINILWTTPCRHHWTPCETLHGISMENVFYGNSTWAKRYIKKLKTPRKPVVFHGNFIKYSTLNSIQYKSGTSARSPLVVDVCRLIRSATIWCRWSCLLCLLTTLSVLYRFLPSYRYVCLHQLVSTSIWCNYFWLTVRAQLKDNQTVWR